MKPQEIRYEEKENEQFLSINALKVITIPSTENLKKNHDLFSHSANILLV